MGSSLNFSRPSKVSLNSESNEYPIQSSMQCLDTYSYTKDVWQTRLPIITSQLFTFRTEVESISGLLQSDDVLEVVTGGGDSKQKLLQDLKELSSLASTIANNLSTMRTNLDGKYTDFSRKDNIALNKWKAHQIAMQENDE